MKLEILGNWAGSPGATGACAGYLVSEDATTVLLDCGPGIVPSLQRNHSCAELDAVFISHMHADHCLDLVTLAYRLIRFSWRHEVSDLETPQPIPLFLPPGGSATLLHLTAAFGRPGPTSLSNPFLGAFEIHECSPHERIRVGSLTLSCFPMQHTVPCLGVRVTSATSALAYSGDTRLCPELLEAAHGVDLFLCEATARDTESPLVQNGGHLTAEQSGAAAEQSRVRQVLLTHISRQDAVWKQGLLSDARSHFNGLLDIAGHGLTYHIGVPTLVPQQ